MRKKWIFLPISITDWGSLEAWLNKKAQKGWRFVESSFCFFAKLSHEPNAPRVVYRIKPKTDDRETITLRKEKGWHCTYTTLGISSELWWKETDDPSELCPDIRSTVDQILSNVHWDLWVEAMLLLEIVIGGIYFPLFAHVLLPPPFSDFLIPCLLGGIHLLLQWRNLRKSASIGWPSIILTTIVGKLFLISPIVLFILAILQTPVP